MSYSNEFRKSTIVGVLAVATLAGCATNRTDGLQRQQVVVNDAVVNTKAVLDPCTREGIKARPIGEVSRAELVQRTNSGETYYASRGFYLFAERSLTERWAPLVGALALGALGNTIGSGGVRAAATIGAGAAGAFGGEAHAGRAKLERMAKESGCEAYLATFNAPAAQPIDLYNRTQQRSRYGIDLLGRPIP